MVLHPKQEKGLTQSAKHNVTFTKIYQPIAIETYKDVMKYYLERDVEVHPSGYMIQPALFWLAAHSTGLISYKSDERFFGLVEIKSPQTKKNSPPCLTIFLFMLEKEMTVSK